MGGGGEKDRYKRGTPGGAESVEIGERAGVVGKGRAKEGVGGEISVVSPERKGKRK
jgi:hypothetical protein